MQRIVVPAAALVGTLAAATAAATITLAFTIPGGQAVVQPGGTLLLPFLRDVLTVLAGAVWAVIGYL
jgi:hypothetical protein